MKITNMKNDKGKYIPNQFIVEDEGRGWNGNFIKKEIFQSYDKIIVERITWENRIDTKLDVNYWNYSKTTSKYRSRFLGETTAETEKKIKSGEYTLTNLN